jgi:hypothetical protein
MEISCCWLDRFPEILGEKKFELCSFEMLHTPILSGGWPSWFRGWMRSVAPMRLGICAESISSFQSARLAADSPDGEKLLMQSSDIATHLLLVDERDQAQFQRLGKPCFWSPGFVPDEMVRDFSTRSVQNPRLMFSGVAYPYRKPLLDYLFSQNVLDIVSPLPSEHLFGLAYDIWCLSTAPVTAQDRRLAMNPLVRYVANLNSAKLFLAQHLGLHILSDHVRNCLRVWEFTRFLRRMQRYAGLLSPPTEGRLLPGRIFEAMSVGVPVVAWAPPDRPMAKRLFAHGEDILWYEGLDGEEALACAQRLLKDPALGKKLARNAQKKIRVFHTASARTRQILHWMETGEEPVLW